jgi:hypothetical protein
MADENGRWLRQGEAFWRAHHKAWKYRRRELSHPLHPRLSHPLSHSLSHVAYSNLLTRTRSHGARAFVNEFEQNVR